MPQLGTTASARLLYSVAGERRKVEIGASGAAPSAVQLVVNGHTYDPATIGQMRPWAKALLNADLRKAGVSAPVANVIAPATPSMVSTARHLTIEQRAQVDACEKSFSHFHNARKTDREIETFIMRKDPGRVATVLDRVLDRMTTPESAK